MVSVGSFLAGTSVERDYQKKIICLLRKYYINPINNNLLSLLRVGGNNLVMIESTECTTVKWYDPLRGGGVKSLSSCHGQHPHSVL